MNTLIKICDKVVNIIVILCFLPLLLYGSYTLYDRYTIHKDADAQQYSSYKPKSNNLSFSELCKKNRDVIGWIQVFGTKIDYPLVQGQDNDKYVNTNVYGKFALSGSIFMDYRNAKDFSDMNTIIYGHHMDKRMMFTDLDRYSKKSYLNKHHYGQLYYDGKWHEIALFAFLRTDAYDSLIYTPKLNDEKQFMDYVQTNAKSLIDTNLTGNDHFISLSTCTDAKTNGRYVLIGRITGKISDKPFKSTKYK